MITRSVSYSGCSTRNTPVTVNFSRRYAAAGFAGFMRPIRRGMKISAPASGPGRSPVSMATPTERVRAVEANVLSGRASAKSAPTGRPSMMVLLTSTTRAYSSGTTPLKTTGIWPDAPTRSARSSMTGVATATPGTAAGRARARESAPRKALPSTGVTFSSGSMALRCAAARSLKPLKTERTMTMAAVATATPPIEMRVMTLTALWDLGARR